MTARLPPTRPRLTREWTDSESERDCEEPDHHSSTSHGELEPFDDSETLHLPRARTWEEEQWWSPELWALDHCPLWCFPPGRCRFAWDSDATRDGLGEPAFKKRRVA